MDRLNKALAKAREMRAGRTVFDDAPAEPATQPKTELLFRYRQTRQLATPLNVLREQRLIMGEEDGVDATAYRMLRTQVLQRLRAHHWRTLALVSPNPGEGTSLTAANLAISLACDVSHTVILVDLDIRWPALHRLFGDEAPLGLSDYLLDDVPVSQLLFNPGIERLVVLPAGKPVTNSSELLSSPKMVQLVEEIKARYPERLVLFDMPPLLATADALAFSPNADAVLLVIEDGKTRREDVTRALELLQNTNVIGTVLNKSLDHSVEK